jgi:Xaa-Pro aminopeptidase/Xaa-Pro dipeptidase
MTQPVFMNIPRWRDALARARLDALLLASPNAIFYATGALLPPQLKSSPSLAARLIDDRPAFALVNADGEAVLLVSDRDAAGAAQHAWVSRVETYPEREGTAVARLAELVRAASLTTSRLGVELRYVTAIQMREVADALPQAKLEPCDDLLTHVRAVKTPIEIEVLTRAGEATAEAIWQAFQASRPGDSEKSLADRIADALFDLGADDIYAAVVGFGENSLHAHNKPSVRRLRAGDIVRVDYGGKFNGFASDLARMGVCGRPSAAQTELYAKWRGVQLGTMRAMRPGVRAQEVYAHCGELARAVGLDLRFPHVGHSFALGGHDYPMLHPHDTTVLEPDMIFCVEPVYPDPHLGMIQIEDLVRVTPDGGLLLTGSRDNNQLWVLPG